MGGGGVGCGGVLLVWGDGVIVYVGGGNGMEYCFFNYKNYVVWISCTDLEVVEKFVINYCIIYGYSPLCLYGL